MHLILIIYYLCDSLYHTIEFRCMCLAMTKETLRQKIKIKFYIARFRGHSTGRFETKIKSLAQCLPESLRILL